MPDLAPDLAAGKIAGPGVGWRHTVIRVDVDVGSVGFHLLYQGAERASLEIAFETRPGEGAPAADRGALDRARVGEA